MSTSQAVRRHANQQRPQGDGPGTGPDPGGEAVAAVHVGVWVSATRCVLTYVVAPAAGALGLVLGPLGLLLQVAGALTSTGGARRLWHLGHRLRVPYAGLALVIDLVTLVTLAGHVGALAPAVLR